MAPGFFESAKSSPNNYREKKINFDLDRLLTDFEGKFKLIPVNPVDLIRDTECWEDATGILKYCLIALTVIANLNFAVGQNRHSQDDTSRSTTNQLRAFRKQRS